MSTPLVKYTQHKFITKSFARFLCGVESDSLPEYLVFFRAKPVVVSLNHKNFTPYFLGFDGMYVLLGIFSRYPTSCSSTASASLDT